MVELLTELLRTEVKFNWTNECEASLRVPWYPIVMVAPDFEQLLSLALDASNVGAGAVLMQKDEQGVKHSVSYFSKMFSVS